MKLDVIIEQRFYRCQNGLYWTANSFPYDFWLRYLISFDEVNIVARVKNVTLPMDDWKRVDGSNVKFIPLPYYIGPKQFVLKFFGIARALNRRNAESECVILRIPSMLSILYFSINLLGKKKTYGVEVVGDPADAFTASASSSSMSWLYSKIFVFFQKLQCKQAVSSSFVTKSTLQKTYPPHKDKFSTYYSSIFLSKNQLKYRDNYQKSDTNMNLIGIGNLSQPYKGADVALGVVSYLVERGIDARLQWIGGGDLIASLNRLASNLGIEERVEFLGNISSRENINMLLDQSDYFVMPSRQEGLPRALIEAMGRGLVCVATRVGGIPELLNDEFIVPPDNIEQFANKLIETAKLDSESLKFQSRKNFEVASQYTNDILDERRKSMYENLVSESREQNVSKKLQSRKE